MACVLLATTGIAAVGCAGGSLTARQSRLAEVYDGAGTLAGAGATLSVTVAAVGTATATLTVGDTSVALVGLVSSPGSLSLAGTTGDGQAASVQGTLSESGGTVSVLFGSARANLALARRASPSPSPSPDATPTPTPRPSPSPTPTPDPGPAALEANLFPLHTGDTWRWDVGGASLVERLAAVETRSGRTVVPRERTDASGNLSRRDYFPSTLGTGYGVIEQVVLTPGTEEIRSQTTLGQPLFLSYSLVRGQAGATTTSLGDRVSTSFRGSVTVRFTPSFLRSERVSVPAGTFDCAVVKTVQETSYVLGGVFQTETTDLTEWRAMGIGPVQRIENGETWTLQSASVNGTSYP